MSDLDLWDAEHDEHQSRRPVRRRRRRGKVWAIVLAVLALIGVGAYFGLQKILDIGGYDDYSGPGEKDVVVEVQEGSSRGQIADALMKQGVVASTKAFIEAGEDDSRVNRIQPGFYVMKTKVSGKDALARIVDKGARKGQFQLRAGSQLDDVRNPDGSVVPGIITLLHTASCVELNGQTTCASAEDLRKVAETADLAQLGAPTWAATAAARTPIPKHRIEGLVLPDVYDVRPGASAEDLWRTLLTRSRATFDSVGMPGIADGMGFTPYDVLIMASLIEREAITADFPKVSRVTYNRLAKPMKLQYDSTINYVLDRPMIRTRPEDRAKAGGYNTYQNAGLPPTPIGSPSKKAIEAAAKPADGPWLFFVKCEKNGLSCFAETNQQHDQNVRDAQARGAW
ncbi:UPF0755 protein [Herbihabitans rhizosphaerae]|uniref:Endolytic murein transglycosylase n=1 Tax=Herbihabitans rhizosphaerae TaxID=1872711 RepID=A0A4Q7L370_9PSEU|nr:endolytic transglycosylase MltG [Herbihabitans rhizosphaerae]RZS43170.1 UPF0755 protein [Herbihabitans rhizosphaerae]